MNQTSFLTCMEIVIYAIPVYSSTICIILMILTYQDSTCSEEKGIRWVLIFYYLFALTIWAGTILFNYQSELFIYLNPLFYLSLLLASVTLYHFIYNLTASQETPNFPAWHYVPPLILCAIIFVWSLFIPYEVQNAIVSSSANIIPEYRYYYMFYESKHVMRILYLIVYVLLSMKTLWSYNLFVKRRYPADYKRYTFWLWYLIGLSIVILLVAMISSLGSHAHMNKLLRNIFIVLFIACGHVVMSYKVMRRNYFLNFSESITTSNPDDEDIGDIEPADYQTNPIGSQIERSSVTRYQRNADTEIFAPFPILNKRNFENYMKKNKPYLDPKYQITDLVEQLKVNRTYISRFINTEYGVNFNRYLNQCRLQELAILQRLPSNKNKELRELVSKAGFGSFRSYLRAKQSEEEQ